MISNSEQGVLESTWSEIAGHAAEFRGRRLRVIILADEAQPSTNERLNALNAWLALPRPDVAPLMDDSRAVIYDEDEGSG